MSFFVLQVALATPLRRLFDYLPQKNTHRSQYLPGQRVNVRFGSRMMTGVIMGISEATDVPESKLKPIDALLDEQPLLTKEDLALAEWLANYYHHSLGEVIEHWLPTLLRRGAALSEADEPGWEKTSHDSEVSLKGSKQRALWELFQQQPHWPHKRLTQQGFSLAQCRKLEALGLIQPCSQLPCPQVPDQVKPPLVLNEQQSKALSQLTALTGTFKACLLEGITGSGKTEVYLQLIQEIINQGKQALVLVPEIGLTPQTIKRFRERFNQAVSLIHSGLNDKERLQSWRLAKEGKARILIGTRSAVFTPMPDLGLIIIDEEHDSSFKQQDGLRYSARDFAMMRGRQANAPVVLGSATPSLETLHNALSGRYEHLVLNQRAGKAKPPSTILHSTLHQPMVAGMSEVVLGKIHQHLAQNKQVMVFINLRGFAPLLACQSCGWMAECPRCDSRLTLHQYPPGLHCHHCDYQQKIPAACPSCHADSLEAIGQGTERLEGQLQSLFPDTPIHRFDRDNVRSKQAFDELFSQIHQGDPCILLGTQMLAKGHHFAKVTLVVILDSDAGLFSSDFRGMEHSVQLIDQVSGRAGREEDPGEVWIQTLYADHPSLNTLIQDGYHALAESMLKDRLEQQLPPYTHMAILRSESENKALANQVLQQARQAIQGWLMHESWSKQPPISLLGPVPAIMEKRNGRYRFQLQIFCEQRPPLHQMLSGLVQYLESLKGFHQVRWSLDVDPSDTL